MEGRSAMGASPWALRTQERPCQCRNVRGTQVTCAVSPPDPPHGRQAVKPVLVGSSLGPSARLSCCRPSAVTGVLGVLSGCSDQGFGAAQSGMAGGVDCFPHRGLSRTQGASQGPRFQRNQSSSW